MINKAVGASSSTYRKVVNELSKAFKKRPKHTQYPSEDFQELIDDIPEAFREKALKWYEMGIKRGMTHATDLMVEGKIHKKDDVVHAPNKIELKTRIKINGGKWEKYKVTIDVKDLGFE